MPNQMFVLPPGQNPHLKLLVHVFLHKLFQLAFFDLFELLKGGSLENHIGKVVESRRPDGASVVG